MECWRPAGEVGLEACCWGSGVSHVCGGLVRCCVVRVSVWRGVRVVVENCIVDASIFIFCCVTCCCASCVVRSVDALAPRADEGRCDLR